MAARISAIFANFLKFAKNNNLLPFPDLYFLVNTNFYIDSGGYGKYLHSIACENS